MYVDMNSEAVIRWHNTLRSLLGSEQGTQSLLLESLISLHVITCECLQVLRTKGAPFTRRYDELVMLSVLLCELMSFPHHQQHRTDYYMRNILKGHNFDLQRFLSAVSQNVRAEVYHHWSDVELFLRAPRAHFSTATTLEIVVEPVFLTVQVLSTVHLADPSIGTEC
jgi:hypothetical protein